MFYLVNYKGECYGEFPDKKEAKQEQDRHNESCEYDYYLEWHLEEE